MSRGTDETADLLTAVEALRAENDRLRGLLGLDERPDDGHAHAWEPTLLTETTDQPSVDASSTTGEKLTLLRSLFGARADVYAQRWASASSGKTGWSPATKDRWAKGRPPKSYLPLTDDVFNSHLRGDETIGIYPLHRDDTCALLACDFDKGTWALDALAYLDACHRNAVPAALERSRSGNGALVWIFFEAAFAARAMGAALSAGAPPSLARLSESSGETMSAVDAPADDGTIPDRRLQLLFACAHPAIDPTMRSPLMLQTVLGLDAVRIAHAFLVRRRRWDSASCGSRPRSRTPGSRSRSHAPASSPSDSRPCSTRSTPPTAPDGTTRAAPAASGSGSRWRRSGLLG